MTQVDARTTSADVPVTKALSAADREEVQRSFAEEGYVVLRNVVSAKS